MSASLGQARADYLEKSRNFSFLALMALCLFAAFWFVPRSVDGFQIMSLQEDVFIQGGNPSWIPVTSALGLAFFLPFIGFFYLRNTMAFDEIVGVDQLIASSATGNARYLIGKFLSGILLLYTFAATVVIGSFFMTLWHFPGQFLSIYAFISPYMFILASVPFCVAVAVLFGSVRFLRGAVGSVIYVIGLFVMLTLPMEIENSGVLLRSLDLTAMSSLMETVSRTAYEQTGQTINSVMFIGGYGPDSDFQPTLNLVFNGLNYNTVDFTVIGTMLLISIGLIILSVQLYGLTKILPDKVHRRKREKQLNITPTAGHTGKPAYKAVAPSNRPIWLHGIVTELKLMLKGQSFIWYLISITGIVLSLFLGMNIVQVYILPLLMLWFVNIFSRLGSREHSHDILTIIATIPGGKLKQIIYAWIAGIIVALILALPVMVRLSVLGQFIGVLAVLAGIIFLPSFAMFLGEFTKTNRVFEMIFIIMTYAIVNGASVVMYMGYPELSSFYQAGAYLIVGVLLGVISVYWRQSRVYS